MKSVNAPKRRVRSVLSGSELAKTYDIEEPIKGNSIASGTFSVRRAIEEVKPSDTMP